MPLKPAWIFPDLPPFLTGLTLEHLARLRALIRAHGQLVGTSAGGDAHGLALRQPVEVFLIVAGASDDAAVIVAPFGEPVGEDFADIALTSGGPTNVSWSPKVALADVLLCLDADGVVKTSQLKKTGKDGSN